MFLISSLYYRFILIIVGFGLFIEILILVGFCSVGIIIVDIRVVVLILWGFINVSVLMDGLELIVIKVSL